MSDDNKRVVRRLLEVIETGDLASADAIISPEFRDHPADGESPGGSADGPEAFKEIALRLRGAFADLRYEEQDAIAEGDKVVLRTVMRGRHESKFGPFPPTGRSFAQQQTHLADRRRQGGRPLGDTRRPRLAAAARLHPAATSGDGANAGEPAQGRTRTSRP